MLVWRTEFERGVFFWGKLNKPCGYWFCQKWLLIISKRPKKSSEWCYFNLTPPTDHGTILRRSPLLCCVQIGWLCCFSCARTVEWGGWVTWRGRLTMFVLNLSELKKQPLTDWSKISSTRRGQLILGWLSLWYLYSILTSDNAWLGQMFNIEDRDTNTWKISEDFGKIWDRSSKVTARYDTEGYVCLNSHH